jgi:penicillin-binding protein 2
MTDLINLNDQQKEADVINGRIIASAVLVMVLSLALVIRLYALQVTQHDYQATEWAKCSPSGYSLRNCG